jgi:hypothetical protein
MEIWKSTLVGGCGRFGLSVEKDMYPHFLFQVPSMGEFYCWAFRPVLVREDIMANF